MFLDFLLHNLPFIYLFFKPWRTFGSFWFSGWLRQMLRRFKSFEYLSKSILKCSSVHGDFLTIYYLQGAKMSLWEASECRGSFQSPINIPRWTYRKTFSGEYSINILRCTYTINYITEQTIQRSGLPKVSVPPLELHDYHIAPETTTLLNDGYTVKMVPKAFK